MIRRFSSQLFSYGNSCRLSCLGIWRCLEFACEGQRNVNQSECCSFCLRVPGVEGILSFLRGERPIEILRGIGEQEFQLIAFLQIFPGNETLP